MQIGEVWCQLLSRSKISICRVLAMSLETKGRKGLFSKEREIVRNVVISWVQLV